MPRGLVKEQIIDSFFGFRCAKRNGKENQKKGQYHDCFAGKVGNAGGFAVVISNATDPDKAFRAIQFCANVAAISSRSLWQVADSHLFWHWLTN